MPSDRNASPYLESDMEINPNLIRDIEQRILEPTPTEVEQVISIIQHHLDKEARNRQVDCLSPEDLCPAQKRDLVRDLTRLLKA